MHNIIYDITIGPRGNYESEIAELEKHAEITDADIEAYFTTLHYDNKNGHHYRRNKDRIFGAKAMLNGEIKHIEK